MISGPSRGTSSHGTYGSKLRVQTASLMPFTEVAGKLGCRTLSILLGVGEAEWHRKVTKGNKGRQIANLVMEKSKKQAAIAVAYSHENLFVG